MVVCPFYYSGINFLSLLDKVKLALMTLLIALTLLLSTVSVEGLKAPASQHAAQLMGEAADSTDGARIQHGASDSDDGVVKFVGSHQSHLLRLEHSLSRDHQPGSVVYELVMSWAQQAILLLLCGLLLYAALCYPRMSFRDHFASIRRHRLQRRHLQYRFSQSFLA